MPVLEASWEVPRGAERMRTLGLETISATGAPSPDARREAVSQTLDRPGNALSQVAGAPALFEDATRANEGAFDLANVIDALADNRSEATAAERNVAAL